MVGVLSIWIIVTAGLFSSKKFFVNADFSSILRVPFFKDNTMLVKYFLESFNKRILVSSPHSSGRTTNLLMLKSFLEISVDDRGNKQEESKTDNYKLFKDNHLNIFQHKEFFEKHFGKYPVIFLNFRTLGNVFNYQELLLEFRLIIQDLFTRHKYLLLHKHLWSDLQEVQQFNKYFTGDRKNRLNPNDMIKGISYLTELLHLHFGKPVILLLDDYDIIAEKRNTDLVTDKEKITHFFKTLYTSLLKINRYIDRVFLTGLLDETDTSDFSYTTLPDDTVSQNGYKENMPVCKFFRHTF